MDPRTHLVRCPYDPHHWVKPRCLVRHLLHCSPPPGYKVCRLNKCHMYKVGEEHQCEEQRIFKQLMEDKAPRTSSPSPSSPPQSPLLGKTVTHYPFTSLPPPGYAVCSLNRCHIFKVEDWHECEDVDPITSSPRPSSLPQPQSLGKTVAHYYPFTSLPPPGYAVCSLNGRHIFKVEEEHECEDLDPITSSPPLSSPPQSPSLGKTVEQNDPFSSLLTSPGSTVCSLNQHHGFKVEEEDEFREQRVFRRLKVFKDLASITSSSPHSSPPQSPSLDKTVAQYCSFSSLVTSLGYAVCSFNRHHVFKLGEEHECEEQLLFQWLNEDSALKTTSPPSSSTTQLPITTRPGRGRSRVAANIPGLY